MNTEDLKKKKEAILLAMEMNNDVDRHIELQSELTIINHKLDRRDKRFSFDEAMPTYKLS